MGKNLKGGYKIIPLEHLELTTASLVIEGLYERIESNYGKPLLLSGITIDGVEKDDIFVKAEVVDSNFVISGVYGYVLTITDDDEVTLSEEPSSEVTRQAIVNATGLVTPLVPPTEGTHELVGIDDANAQEKIKIGEGLKVENGELKSKIAFNNASLTSIKFSDFLSYIGVTTEELDGIVGGFIKYISWIAQYNNYRGFWFINYITKAGGDYKLDMLLLNGKYRVNATISSLDDNIVFEEIAKVTE